LGYRIDQHGITGKVVEQGIHTLLGERPFLATKFRAGEYIPNLLEYRMAHLDDKIARCELLQHGGRWPPAAHDCLGWCPTWSHAGGTDRVVVGQGAVVLRRIRTDVQGPGRQLAVVWVIRPDDLLVLAKLADQAHSWIHRQMAQDAASAGNEQAEEEGAGPADVPF